MLALEKLQTGAAPGYLVILLNWLVLDFRMALELILAGCEFVVLCPCLNLAPMRLFGPKAALQMKTEHP